MLLIVKKWVCTITVAKYRLGLTALVILMFWGCQWDPPHDNPFDPKVPPAPLSMISIQVIDLGRNPINKAKVILRDLNSDHISSTDSAGWAYFDNLPVDGVWWAIADRISEEIINYAVDSVEVTSSLAEPLTKVLSLDALPYFSMASVNSEHNQLGDVDSEIRIKLKAEAIDPDGVPDIESITWEFNTDSLHLVGDLQYHPNTDSLFYFVVLDTSVFRGSIGLALTSPFNYTVTDIAQNTESVDASLIRIIRGHPLTGGVPWSDPLLISWSYTWRDDFNPGDIWHYELRIEKQNPDFTRSIIYHAILNDQNQRIDYEIYDIPPGNYDYYVWVIDEFGNYSRSIPKKIILPNDN